MIVLEKILFLTFESKCSQLQEDSRAGKHGEPLNELLGEDPRLGLPEMVVVLS